ncbi:MAG: hypothetical protein A2516_03125 [Alphaproteobacteria bacterium RIFOXYD12_FULL_60_8]|nr:MAG: hypothetical protein A2516_03125 [Alphaproteobacteria bacterium RIFOXYD12_FULL_60_8]
MTESAALGPTFKNELLTWARLAVAALGVAGLLAFGLALPRFPGIKDFLSPDFFYRSLITHVVFSVVVWYLAALGALTVYASGRVSARHGVSTFPALGAASKWLGVASFAFILIPYLTGLGQPLINNYVPTLTHPLFHTGLVLLALAVALLVLRLGVILFRSRVSPQGIDFAIAASGVIYLIALGCFGIAWAQLPADLHEATFNERLFWGGGHVLQFVYALIAMTAWNLLAERVAGQSQVSEPFFRLCAGVLTVLALPSLGIYAAFDVLSYENREAFTQLLWYGLSLPPAVMLLASMAQLIRLKSTIAWTDPLTLGYALSLALFAVGGVLGYFLGVSDTRTPSHYHAVIGGVNLALMTLYFSLILPLLGRAGFKPKVVRWMLGTYGVGQLIQIIGLYWAGAAGVPRKTAGAAQGLDSAAKKIAMGIQGGGAGIAIIGGIIFVWVVGLLLFRAKRGTDE